MPPPRTALCAPLNPAARRRKSPLSESVRARLPGPENVDCVLRNGNWVVQYWGSPETCPDPLGGGHFGFARDARGRPRWEDDLPPTGA